MTNYYIYYRIDPKRLDEIGFAVKEIFKAVKNETGIQGKWLRRRDEPTTYMEVYEGVKDDRALEALLEREGRRFALPRRREVFVAAEPPAGNR